MPVRLTPYLVAALLLLAACTDPADPEDPGTTTAVGTTTDGPAGTTTDDPPTPTTGEPVPPDMGVGDGQCDPWLQDCPDGYKCMAWTEEGMDFFSGNKCTPVVADPAALGDPCSVVDGWWTGIDDCDYGLACWDLDHDTNTGRCVAMCTGGPDAATCPQQEDVCSFWVPGIAHVCLTTCDPLLQDCDPAQACIPEWGSNAAEWVCAAEYSKDEGQEFDPCAASNTCDPGLMCWNASAAIECAGFEVGCCLSLCDLDNPQCNGQGAECTSFYGVIDGQAPPEFERVGLCVVPG